MPRPRRRRNDRGSRSRSRSTRQPAKKKFVLTPIIEDEKFEWEKADEAGIIFWCMECHEMVEPEKKGKKLTCPKCGKEKMVFGTKKSVQNYVQHKKDLFAR